jgi:hypothetical protein
MFSVEGKSGRVYRVQVVEELDGAPAAVLPTGVILVRDTGSSEYNRMIAEDAANAHIYALRDRAGPPFIR